MMQRNHNGLLFYWEFPYQGVHKRSDVFYVIELGRTKCLFTMNILKCREERTSRLNSAEGNLFVAVEDVHNGPRSRISAKRPQEN